MIHLHFFMPKRAAAQSKALQDEGPKFIGESLNLFVTEDLLIRPM